MDYIKQIFDTLGVEPNEEFGVDFSGYIYKFKLDSDLHLSGLKPNTVDTWLDHDSCFHKLLNGVWEIIKLKHPTKQEQLAIDYAKACGCKWIAKEKSGNVWGFKRKPYKDKYHEAWAYEAYAKFANEPVSDVKIEIPISFISWDDEEPYYISD